MSVKPRTIDNLGIETSSRYARDQAQLDPKLIQDSRLIPLKTEVSVVKPYLPTEFEEYLQPAPLTLWASFEPPPHYFSSTQPLFTYQLIPSLGTSEHQESTTDKIEALEDSLSKDSKGGQQNQEREEEKERKKILHLLKTIHQLDRSLGIINSRRSQYQRG